MTSHEKPKMKNHCRHLIELSHNFLNNIDASTHKSPIRSINSSSDDSGDESDQEESESSHKRSARKASKNIVNARRPSILAASAVASRTQHFGSFYLRMGAVGKYLFTYFFADGMVLVYEQF
jgi:hypothetical protein